VTSCLLWLAPGQNHSLSLSLTNKKKDKQMTKSKLTTSEQFELKTPPASRNGYKLGVPTMSEFIAFLNANEGVWALFHTYPNKQSGYQRASDNRKKYGDAYEFVARHDENGTSVYGKKNLVF
jgi:hypothetical protein